MSPLDTELQNRIAELGPVEKRRLLEYVRRLHDDLPPTASGAELLRFAGRIPKEDLQQMWAAIQDAREASINDG